MVRGIVIGAGLLAASCARSNPAFDAATDDVGVGSVGSGDDAPASTTRPQDDGSTNKPGVDDGPLDDSGVADTGNVSGTGTGVLDTGLEDTGASCSSFGDVSIGIALSSNARDAIAPDCGQLAETAEGPITVSGSSITVAPCGGCPCESAAETFTATISRDIDIPILPDCGSMVAWGQHDDEGVCNWVGIAVVDAGQSVPAWFATDSRTAPSDLIGGFVVDLEPIETCSSGECPEAGEHALVFGDTLVGMGDPPTPVEVAFAASIPYIVENLASWVDVDCREHVAWTAVEM